MNIRQRAETFSTYVGLELKGRITTQGFTAKHVATAIGRQPAAFNRWLNGKVELPMSVLCEACEFINIEPSRVIDDAYSRLAVEFGERDGRFYPAEEFAKAVPGGDDVTGTPDLPTNVRVLNVRPQPQDDLRAVATERDEESDEGYDG